MATNQKVGGSSPLRRAKKIPSQQRWNFFIQSEGLVCHQRARALYGIATKSRMASRAARIKPIHLRIDSIHPFGMIPYRRQAADFIHGFAVILRVAILYYELQKIRYDLGVILLSEYHASSIRLLASDIADAVIFGSRRVVFASRV